MTNPVEAARISLILGEVVDRAQVHIHNIQRTQQLDWYIIEDMLDLRPSLYSMCQEVVEQLTEKVSFPAPDDDQLLDIGIKCVEYIGDNILK